MYSSRSYGSARPSLAADPIRFSLTAIDSDNNTLGIISIDIDSSKGLFSHTSYRGELDALREQGRKPNEYNRFAIDNGVNYKRVLAGLFHIARFYPWGLFGCTDGVLEVNIRRATFYEMIQGFKLIGEERVYPRDNAPSVLLRARFSEVLEKTQSDVARMSRTMDERSLILNYFNHADSMDILERLRAQA